MTEASHEVPVDEESVGRGVYESLVRMTYLCGRGLPLNDLLLKFLKVMRVTVPACGVWLHREQTLVVHTVESGISPDVPPPPRSLPALLPIVLPGGFMHAHVLPGLTLTCRLKVENVQRATDVVTLFARIIALVWLAEHVSQSEPLPDDYDSAKDHFKRRWLGELMQRHAGNISEAARAGGVSRVHLYEMLKQYGIAKQYGFASGNLGGN